MDKVWLRINELENAIDYLEMASQFLGQLSTRIKWKWAIIASHQALYGFAICALRGTCPKKRVLRNDGGLIGIHEALKRCEDPAWMGQYTNSQVLVRTAEEKAAINLLVKEFRNNFEHFTPMSWSIEVTGLPLMLSHAARVIRFLALESNNVTYQEDSQKLRVEHALQEFVEGLNESS